MTAANPAKAFSLRVGRQFLCYQERPQGRFFYTARVPALFRPSTRQDGLEQPVSVRAVLECTGPGLWVGGRAPRLTSDMTQATI